MRIAVLALALAVGHAAGCKPSVDAEEGEKAISEWVEQQLGIHIDEAHCPRDVPRKKGKTFKCTAKAEGGELVIRVTQTNDEGNTRFSTGDIDGIIVSARLEDQVEQAFRERADMDVVVDCGRRHRVAVPGETFNCDVDYRDDKRAVVAVTTEDRVGNVSWRLDR